jgi:Ca-activated chloride channel family protein
VDQSLKRRNIMLVVDVSKSMEAQDFPQAYGYVQRMEGVRVVVEAYVTARSSEFIGLVVFGERAYLQSPLTTDNALVAELVRSLEAGMAGDGTAIGDGLGVALKRLRDVEGDSKAIILLTDGANNAGSMSPVKAAQIARDLGIKIHAIGIGSGEASIRGKLQGGLAGLSVPAVADYDEKTLRAIASETQGVFFNARSLDELSKVYEEIDRLESSERLAPKRQLVEELFAPYALAGTIMVLAALVLGSTIFLRTP